MCIRDRSEALTAIVLLTTQAVGMIREAEILTVCINISLSLIHISLRYRSYYYDSETGYYHLKSRYYSPEVGRWISPEPNVDYGNSGII